MNYYERHLGDYARDTGHLSALEHGVYNLLLDRYYVTEQGIPEQQAYRLARARTEDERLAVDAVLSEFFELKDGVWINRRAQEEIARYQDKQRKASASANARWSKDKAQCDGNANASKTQCDGNAHQTPDTRHQTSNKTHTVTSQVVGDLTTGSVCVFLREKFGFIHTNPDHPDLIAALGGGATQSDFAFAAQEAVNKGKGFAYALKIVLGNLEEQKNATSNRTSNTGHRRLSAAERASHAVRRADELAERERQAATA